MSGCSSSKNGTNVCSRRSPMLLVTMERAFLSPLCQKDQWKRIWQNKTKNPAPIRIQHKRLASLKHGGKRINAGTASGRRGKNNSKLMSQFLSPIKANDNQNARTAPR